MSDALSTDARDILDQLPPIDAADGWAYAKHYNTESARRAALPTWLHFYNHHRPHAAIGKLPPINRLSNNLPGHYSKNNASWPLRVMLGLSISGERCISARRMTMRKYGHFPSIRKSLPSSPLRKRTI